MKLTNASSKGKASSTRHQMYVVRTPPSGDRQDYAAGSSKLRQSEEDTPLAQAPLDGPEELAAIRLLLRPPPIEGQQNWGILPEPEEPCDPALEVKRQQ